MYLFLTLCIFCFHSWVHCLSGLRWQLLVPRPLNSADSIAVTHILGIDTCKCKPMSSPCWIMQLWKDEHRTISDAPAGSPLCAWFHTACLQDQLCSCLYDHSAIGGPTEWGNACWVGYRSLCVELCSPIQVSGIVSTWAQVTKEESLPCLLPS